MSVIANDRFSFSPMQTGVSLSARSEGTLTVTRLLDMARASVPTSLADCWASALPGVAALEAARPATRSEPALFSDRGDALASCAM